MVDNGFVGVTCSPVCSFNRYVAALEAKCLFRCSKHFISQYSPCFRALVKLPPLLFCLMSLINICIHLVTEDSTSTSVAHNVQSQPTLERWEDRHVRLLIKSYLKLKDLIGQGNNTKKGLFDKIAVEFNKRETLCARGVQ